MIDEKVLIEKLKKRIALHEKDADDFASKTMYMHISTMFQRVADETQEVIELVEEQPKGGEWIPIGQYPTEPVLLCFEDGSQSVGYYEENDDVVICCGSDYVTTYDEPIAFKWLPEPYKKEVTE